MFLPFLFELRKRGVPVGTQEALAIAGALKAGLHDSSLDGFYHVARALLVHSETQLDTFDQAFLAHFQGVESAGLEVTRELLEWLNDAREKRELTDEERAQQQQALQEAIATGREQVVVDLAGVTFLDSAGLSVVFGTQRNLPVNQRMVLVNVADRMRRMLRLAAVESIVEVHGPGEPQPWLDGE